jgi:hypothetical protein
VFDIFVSYRAADTRFGAAATYELLATRFGRERIFLDNQSMRPGSNYPQQLWDALESMRVLLVLIGPQWLAGDARGEPLIQRDDDWVRREIRHAFLRAVPVVPVLLDGTGLPAAGALPEEVRRLTHCQATEVRHHWLGADIARLADAVDGLLLDPAVAVPTGDGHRLRRVREVDDPVPLGVHPSPARAPATAVPAGLAPRVPAYVRRDMADRLAWALTATPFVLVVGDATAGKSRLAYEVVRERLPGHWFAVPDGAADLHATLERAGRAGGCVVWLDDLERYLGPDGLTVQAISALGDRRVVLVGTIRSLEHARLSPRWERAAAEPGRLRSRLGRDVIRLAYEIHLGRHWSEAEVGRASASRDPRVTEAARHAHEFGVAEYLASGPQLLAEWHDAWAPGNHPRAAALVAAAVDVSRAGVRRGVGVALLRRLHGRHLAARGGAALRPEPFDEALSWATETLHATSSLLVPDGRGRYRPFGYLVDATETSPDQADVPEDTWRVLITRVPPADCWHVGEAAYARRLLDVARAAFERAAGAGHPSAELKVADCVGESGRRGEALDALRGIVTERTRAAGSRDPTTLEARQALARWTGRAGDPRGATLLLDAVVRDLAATAGPAHPDTLTARHALANWLGRAGRLDDAIAAYRRLAEDRARHHAPDHPDTLSARHEMANWLGRNGNTGESLREHEDVTVAMVRTLGAEHPETLRSRHRLTRLICEVRGTDVGLPLLARVVADRVRVLGPDHPDTLRSRSQYVRWTGKAGRYGEAVVLAGQLTTDTARAEGAGHPDTLRARHQHARWTSEAGDHARAVALFRELVADWDRLLGGHHPYTLISRYRLVLAVAGTGARSEATALLADLLADDLAVLGGDHPYTSHARELLARWESVRDG